MDDASVLKIDELIDNIKNLTNQLDFQVLRFKNYRRSDYKVDGHFKNIVKNIRDVNNSIVDTGTELGAELAVFLKEEK